eukprot:10770771-Lingulodinium_polyedra.AAC.1
MALRSALLYVSAGAVRGQQRGARQHVAEFELPLLGCGQAPQAPQSGSGLEGVGPVGAAAGA